MWSTEVRGHRSAAVRGEEEKRGKLSNAMAMILGIFVTLEIMVAGAMVLNYDYRGADVIAVVFAFVVLYSAVVAALAA
ncbi:MAG: hypothetical protein Q4D55_08655 [Eubacteriales bacterium]|nr:hypothetical protein [Eubacteriales bacterium]